MYPETIPNPAPFDDRREVRPSYDDLLYEAMQILREASDHRSQGGTREQDNKRRNSLLNEVKDLISEAQERL